MTDNRETAPIASGFRYYLNLGSNLGNPRENISKAIGRIEETFGKGISSKMVGSEPWGFDSTNSFVNIAFVMDSELPPEIVLRMLKNLEKELSPIAHRNADGSYRDREIDIDIMTVWAGSELTLSTPELTLPHPHLQERPFFTEPLQELYGLKHIVIRKEGRNTFVLLDSDGQIPTLKQTSQIPISTVFRFGDTTVASETLSDCDIDGLSWVELRKSWGALGDEQWALASKAAELVNWDNETRYCGRCGKSMKRTGEIQKNCTECGAERFPKLSPSVLALVEKGNEALLVHGTAMRGGMHALVAGFVETGETLEECVCREVFEETGMKVENVRYFGSQSWPFPGQLMTAFRCSWVSGEPRWADGELNAGGFMSRNEIDRRLAEESPETFTLPTLPSLSRRLIEAWRNDL